MTSNQGESINWKEIQELNRKLNVKYADAGECEVCGAKIWYYNEDVSWSMYLWCNSCMEKERARYGITE